MGFVSPVLSGTIAGVDDPAGHNVSASTHRMCHDSSTDTEPSISNKFCIAAQDWDTRGLMTDRQDEPHHPEGDDDSDTPAQTSDSVLKTG